MVTTKGRSFCATCRKNDGHVDVMTLSEALLHRDNNEDHHLVVNPDAEDKERGEFE